MSRPANPLRGETSITVEGCELILRPSFENLVAAEEELGSLFALVERASGGELTLKEIATLLWHCLPVDQRPDRNALGSVVLDMGLVQAIAPVRAILAEVLKGEA